MKNWIVVVFVFFTCVVFAQPEKAQTEIIGGKKFYVHFVQSGNTLWGIHKLYNVPVEEIIKANPGTEKGVNEGQKIIIPVPLETVLHEVQHKETLFSISKKYSVTVESIVSANPEIENGLKTGQKIKIPGVEREFLTSAITSDVIVPVDANNTQIDSTKAKTNTVKVSFTDTLITHVVLDQETLYSISKRFMVSVEELQKVNGMKNSKIKPGDSIKIPIKKEKVEIVKIRAVSPVEIKRVDSTLLYPKRNKYKIAILLPFFLDNGEANSEYKSTLATEFYMGAKLAIDSLEKLGLNAEVFVYDTRNDSTTIKKVLLKPEFKGMDLVFGPLFSENVDVVARWCKANNARLICPAAANPSILKGNPFVYSAIPSDATLMQEFAEFTLRNNNRDQVILIKSPNEKDHIMYEKFRSTFLTAAYSGVRPKLIEATLENYASFMKKGVRIVLVFPTNEKLQAVKFMNSLNTVGQKFESGNIYVYGTKEWINFDDVKPHFRNRYNFHFASPNDLNYKYEKTEKLHRSYRSEYNSDMTKMAVQGFDVMFYFCADLLMNRKASDLVMNSFDMVQLGVENGFENSNAFIIEQEEYELINVGNE